MVLMILFLSSAQFCSAQILEWQLVNPTYSSVDPDGPGGPANGVVSFTLQIHTTSGTIANVNAISTGYSYQSASAMIPNGGSGPGCPATVSSPGNIQLSPAFISAGFGYNTVNQCLVNSQSAGAQTLNRTASGTLFSGGAGITLTTAWTNIFTVTLWTLGASHPEGGYVAINSGAGGSPGPLGTYEVSDNLANPYVVNSLTFATPLALGSAALPVLFSKFEAKCSNTGTVISWATQQEMNSSHFELEKSLDGNTWKAFSTVGAAGNSGMVRNYQQVDLTGGAALYRIKQVDKDGRFIYTDIARVNCETKNLKSLVYPVPARDVLNVVINSDRNIRTQLMVYDIHGKLVRKTDAPVVNGTNNFRISLLGLAAGEYLLRSNDATLIINKTFTVVR